MKFRIRLVKTLFALVLLALGAPLRAQPPEPRIEVLARPVIADIKQKKETVEGAWEKRRLGATLTLGALESESLINQGLAFPSPDTPLMHELVFALLQHEPDTLDNLSELPTRALAHIGNALGKRRDARAIEVYEEVLRRQPARSVQWTEFVDGSLYNLSNYYQSTGQMDKSIETLKRVYDYTTGSVLLANYELHLARAYEKKGDAAEAANWYQALQERGDPRTIGISHIDRAEQMFKRGQTDDARALLLAPLGKLTPQATRNHEFSVALLFHVAQSYEREGDLQSAADYADQAATLFGKNRDSGDPYVQGYGPQAESLRTKLWARQDAPFYWEQEDVYLFANPQSRGAAGESRRVALRFNSAPKGEIKLSCDNPAVEIEPVAAAKSGEAALTRIFYLRLNPDKIKGSSQNTLTARAPEFGDYSSNLTVVIRVPQTRTPAK